MLHDIKLEKDDHDLTFEIHKTKVNSKILRTHWWLPEQGVGNGRNG